jgi:hypothetical protein
MISYLGAGGPKHDVPGTDEPVENDASPGFAVSWNSCGSDGLWRKDDFPLTSFGMTHLVSDCDEGSGEVCSGLAKGNHMLEAMAAVVEARSRGKES